MTTVREERARSSLVGLCMGDSFGETFFFPTATVDQRIRDRELAERPWRYTDDTAQAAVLTRHLIARGTVEQDEFASELAQEYLRDPRRGYGANAHDLLKGVAAGADWRKEAQAAFGGMGSMGNGAAMRVAPLGAFFADDVERVATEARRSAVVTHANTNAVEGAVAVAVAAALFARGDSGADQVWNEVLDRTADTLTRGRLEDASRLDPSTPVVDAADTLGSGWRVCAHDTVPFAIWCTLRHADSFEEAMWATVSGLGDRDTTCAIVGGILGASGRQHIPQEWTRRWEGLP
jgi:ADP-ribosylglycohydrolase